MNTTEFIHKWRNKTDYINGIKMKPSIGIGIHWNKIRPESVVKQYFGEKAWHRIADFYTPLWTNFDRTLLRKWLDVNRPDYSKFIDEEKKKIELIKNSGMQDYEFCAFANTTGDKGILADGSHRFIDCNYLMLKEGLILDNEISKTILDVLCVENLREVLTPVDIVDEFIR